MIIRQEKFPVPPKREEFIPLWGAHGLEVRNAPLQLDYEAYERIEREGRLIWVVARDGSDELPIGYSCHWWYQSMHFREWVGHDDIWFVARTWRRAGIGRSLRLKGLEALRAAGAVSTSDFIRNAARVPDLMAGMGYMQWGTWWMKLLTGPDG